MKSSAGRLGVALFAAAAAATGTGSAEKPERPRARDLGIPFSGAPGTYNSITDVPGVEVGHRTIVKDLDGGRAVRTGVTAILPRGARTLHEPVAAGVVALNGNGELTGAHWIEESGGLEGPVLITNTHSVGAVHEGAIRWRVAQDDADASGYWWSLPAVAETWDGHLNDINGFHVRPEDAAAAITAAHGGRVAEGNVGGGTGMICHEFKCGIGTASRRVDGRHVGALVQANYGLRDTLTIAGAPVGAHLRADRVYSEEAPDAGETGSIIVVIATDAPLLPHQLKRLARRAGLGLARVGGRAGNGSGDIFIAFSTAEIRMNGELHGIDFLPNAALDPFFGAVVEATEEAIVNALIAAEDMTGDQGRYAKAIDHAALQDVLMLYNRLDSPAGSPAARP